MRWTGEQKRLLQSEYTRVGYRQGELWPTQAHGTADEILKLFALIPDGTGLPGYLRVLQDNPARLSPARRLVTRLFSFQEGPTHGIDI